MRQDDFVTVAAVGTLAYVGADLAHHALGHGAACLILGGRVLSLSSIYVGCTVTGEAVDLAGPLANFVVGLAFLAASFYLRKYPALMLFLLLSSAFNLFWFAGQLVFSAANGTDDWDQLLRTLRPEPMWRLAFVTAGVACYLLAIRGLGLAFRGFAGTQALRFRRIAFIAYAAGGLTACLTSLRDPSGLFALLHHGAPQALILPIGLLLLRPTQTAEPIENVTSNPALLICALIIASFSVAYLGPGVIQHTGERAINSRQSTERRTKPQRSKSSIVSRSTIGR